MLSKLVMLTVGVLIVIGPLTFCWLDKLTIAQLFFLAMVFRITGAHFSPWRNSLVPEGAAAAFFLLYFLHRYGEEGDEFSDLVVGLMRAACGYQLACGAVTIAVATENVAIIQFRLIARRISNAFYHVKKFVSDLIARVPRRAPPPCPVLPPAPKPTKTQRMQQLAAAAHAEYEAEMAVLRSLPLDQDEQEVLEIGAKQRLLEKLSHLNEV